MSLTGKAPKASPTFSGVIHHSTLDSDNQQILNVGSSTKYLYVGNPDTCSDIQLETTSGTLSVNALMKTANDLGTSTSVNINGTATTTMSTMSGTVTISTSGKYFIWCKTTCPPTNVKSLRIYSSAVSDDIDWCAYNNLVIGVHYIESGAVLSARIQLVENTFTINSWYRNNQLGALLI